MERTIFDSVTLKNGIVFKNRLFMSPMTTQSAYYDGEVNQPIIDYYAYRSGDAAAIIVESLFVENHGRGFPGAVGIDTDAKIIGLKKLASAIKEKGSLAIAQIYHAGRMAWPEYNFGARPIAPSPVAALRPNAPVPQEMSNEEIEEMITLFGDATRRAIEAGFDGVEIHGANTFLLQQFFSPHSNRRRDKWGGSREKRTTFPIEIIKEVKRVATELGKDQFIIGYRFSPEELEEPGIRFEDTMFLLNKLAEYEILSYVHFSMGAYDRPSIVDTKNQEPLITKYLAQRSEKLEEIPVMGVGSILQVEDAEVALQLGYDLLAAGKAFLIEPNWVEKLRNHEKMVDYAHPDAQERLLIPGPLWGFMEYMVIDPELEKERHERLKKLQDMTVTFKPGTYEVAGKGHNSQFPIKVTFSKDRIEDIEVDNSGESDGLSDQVFEVLPQQMIEGQTLNVDAISGASASSEGLIEGVAEAIELAGGDVEVMKSRPKPAVQWLQETVEEEVDLVVIGGGAAGIAASLRADELGLKTILIEKMSFIGGAISISGGNQVVMGSKLQHEAGVTDDTPELMIKDFMKNGENKNVPELLELFAHNVGPATDWIHDYVGVQYDMAGGLHLLPEYQKDRELAYDDGGHGFAATARKKLADSNVKVYLETKAEQITTKDGEVTGLVATELTGRKHKIKTKALILASGGYGNNPNLLSDELRNKLYYGPASATGDGIILATAYGIDAATRMMDYGKIYPNGVEVSAGFAKSTIGGNIAVLRENALIVDVKGNRVVNERSSNHDILKVQEEQDPELLYLLMDQEHFDIFKKEVAEGGIYESDIDRWLSNDDSTTPYFFQADTLEELAQKAGMEKDALAKTVARYNHFVEEGVDEDFGRQAQFLQKPVGDGPYYLVEQKPRFATTMGGLVVDTGLHVQNKEGHSIKGLYAAGETVGGVMGTDSPSGANNAWALTSGKLAAESVVKDNQ